MPKHIEKTLFELKFGQKNAFFCVTDEFWQKGDTAVTIQTKTIETYDASKKML